MTETGAVGFIGLGVMGRPMARNLLKRGFPLVVHSRSRWTVDELVAAGATAAASPADVARRARRIVTMLPDSPDVAAVMEGPDGAFSALKERGPLKPSESGTLLIDCSTIAPAAARRLAGQAASLGASMLDAPVSGGEIGAINATLSIMVGGDTAAFDEARLIFEAMGNPERIVHIGPSGSGQICKVCNQLAIGGALAAVGEAFGLARRAGVDTSKVREALLGGFAASRVLEVHGERLLQSNYKPGFRAKLYQKDMRIAAETLAEHHAAAPVTTLVRGLVDALVDVGRGEEDYSAVATMLISEKPG
jgi:2-hydroxy-3-oxopropionate reductase